MQTLVDEISKENEELTKERDKLASQTVPGTSEGGERHSLQDINTMRSDLEAELRTLDRIASEIFESTNVRSKTVNAQIKDFLEVKEKLDRRTGKLKAMINEREFLRKQNTELEEQIADTEAKIRELAQNHFSTEEARNQHYDLHQQVSELESKKEDLLAEIDAAEANLQNLNEEVKNSGLDDKSLDPSNYEVLLSLSDFEVNSELKKVDIELEELTEQIRILKTRENDIKDFENYGNTSKIKLNTLPRNDNLRSQIKNSQEIVEVLDSEKHRAKGDMSKQKRDSFIDGGLSDKLSALNNIIEKRKIKDDENTKYLSENLVTDIEKTLNKAKQLSFGKRDSADLSDL